MRKHLLTVPTMLVMAVLSGCYSTQPRCASGFCSEEADVVEIETVETQAVYTEATPVLVREDIAKSQPVKAPCTTPVDLKSGTAACAAPVAAVPDPAPKVVEPVQPLVAPRVQVVDAKDVPEDALVEPMVIKQAPTPCQPKPTCMCAQTNITYAPCPCKEEPAAPACTTAPQPQAAPCACGQVEEVKEEAKVEVQTEPSEQDKILQEMQELQAQKEALTAERAQLEAQLKNWKTTEKTSVEVRDWVAAEGVTLRTLLTEWGDMSGWRVIWNMDRDYTLEASATFRGRFVDVASALVRSFARATPAPKAVFYQGNKVLVVSTREDENAE